MDSDLQNFSKRVDDVAQRLEKTVYAGSQKSPPLYHYTTPQGLLGIVQEQTIHANDASGMNDSLELRYIHSVLARVAEPLPVTGEIDRILKQGIVDSPRLHLGAFISSFSEDPDCLSQWRAYANDGCGYSIGFREGLRLRVESNDDYGPPPPVVLGRVLYNEQDQLALLSASVKELASLLGEFARKSTFEHSTQAAHTAVSKFNMTISRIAPLIKNPGFREEREWRATVRFIEQMYPAGPLAFKPSRHGLSVGVRLVGEDLLERLPLSEIVLGPKLDAVNASRTAKYLLREHGYARVDPTNEPPQHPLKKDDPVRVWHSSVSYR